MEDESEGEEEFEGEDDDEEANERGDGGAGADHDSHMQNGGAHVTSDIIMDQGLHFLIARLDFASSLRATQGPNPAYYHVCIVKQPQRPEETSPGKSNGRQHLT